MIDIHCHILAGTDDGPAGIEESVEMARIASGDGIRTIIATPHIKDSFYPPGLIQERVDDLNRRLYDLSVPLRVLRGFDVNALLDPSLLGDYTIEGTSYLLVEFPHTHLPGNARDILFNLVLSGYRPIITHPERNPSVIRDPRLLPGLIEISPLVQITAGSLLGEFGPEIQECAIHLLRRDFVSFIATDAHSSRSRRPVLSEALRVAERVIGKESARRLVSANPEAVIRGRPLHV